MVGRSWLEVRGVLAVSVVGLVLGQVPVHPEAEWWLSTN